MDGHAGLPGGATAVEGEGETVSAHPFVMGRLAGGELLQMSEKQFAVGQATRADLPRHARGEDLLGAAAADLQETLDDSAVDPRMGQGGELSQNLV